MQAQPEPPVDRRPPSLMKVAPATAALAVLCALTLLLENVFPAFIGYGMALIPGRLTGEVVWQAEGLAAVPAILTPLSMTFVHGGAGHLIANMVMLLFLGRSLEPLLGTGRFLALYFGTAYAGGLLEVALSPESAVPIVGASGAIAGLFAAQAMIFGRSKGGATQFQRALQLAAVWIALQILIGFIFNSGVEGGGIAIWAHVGGFLAGLVLALPMARAAIAGR